jgi:hypothetical protein
MVPARFDSLGRPLAESTYLAKVAEAKKRCDICVVANLCRDYGLAISAHVEDHGVYGGLTMEERHHLLGRISEYRPDGAPIRKCGSASGYHRHERLNEAPCKQCRAWKAERQRDYRERKKARRGHNA